MASSYEAAPGAEVVWPAEWCSGPVIPLWQCKGHKKDKNSWRGITLLSVGSKLIARVVATRLRSWFDAHLGLNQFGFRRGRGVDDALQLTRRLVEEVATSAGEGKGIELAFHDIEKAYPRVCRGALWDLLAFNIYHAAVMLDFRARRKEAAKEGTVDEGVDWVAQIDGSLFRPRALRKRGRCQIRTVIGDVEFADDTVTCSRASFAPNVEALFDTTLTDWSQKRNVGKTDDVEGRPRVSVVRHVGGLLSAAVRHDHDTSHRISRARRMIGMLARSWAKGQKDKRGRASALSLPLRLRLMKAHVDPILTTFCRSRSWTEAQLRALRRAQAYALRRAFGLDRFSMQEEHISDKMMLAAAEWDPIDVVIRRACWKWLRHVARMHVPALPKIALWGWPLMGKPGSRRRLQGSWLRSVLAKTSLSPRDWFRVAVSRGWRWQAVGRRFFVRKRISKDQTARGLEDGLEVLLFLCLSLRERAGMKPPPLPLSAPFVEKTWAQSLHWVHASVGAVASSVPRPQPNHWIVATDGSASPPSPKCPATAGWGFLVQREGLLPGIEVECWGEVLVDDRDPRALGVDSLTNNAGELWAIAELFCGLGMSPGMIALFRLPWYMVPEVARGLITEPWAPQSHLKLIALLRDLYVELCDSRVVQWVHVRSHGREKDPTSTYEAFGRTC